MISIRHVTKRFPGVTALADVSFEVVAGELHAIVGENGAGKSTLMKILSGVLPDYEGTIAFRGQTVRFGSTRDAEQAGVAIIHQELNLIDDLSAAANIFLGREQHNRWGVLDQRNMDQRAAALLAELECHVPPGQPVRGLRIGDRQLVEIAKALSLAADVLIMDEPTSALTDAEVARLDRVIGRLRARGVTILYISHKLDEVFRWADRITVLRDGRLVRTLVRSTATPREVTHLMVGRDLEAADAALLAAGLRSVGEVVLEVEQLSLPWPSHARQWRLKDISFSLRRGEIVGIAGLLGAGRTELLECLFGASTEQPTGSIRLAGREVRFASPSAACAAGMALVTEDRKRLGLFSQMDVGRNISLCKLAAATWNGFLSRRVEQELAQSQVEQLAIKAAGLAAPITSLSGGNQQKAIIGRWLLTQPQVLLLDDPTRGVDVGAKAEIYGLMDRLCREGMAILVTSSELPELLTVCDRIVVLSGGRLTAEFSRGEATEQRIMEAATRIP